MNNAETRKKEIEAEAIPLVKDYYHMFFNGIKGCRYENLWIIQNYYKNVIRKQIGEDYIGHLKEVHETAASIAFHKYAHIAMQKIKSIKEEK